MKDSTIAYIILTAVLIILTAFAGNAMSWITTISWETVMISCVVLLSVVVTVISISGLIALILAD